MEMIRNDTYVPCEYNIGCNACVSIPYCVFLIFITGKGICVNKEYDHHFFHSAVILKNHETTCDSETGEILKWTIKERNEIRANTLKGYDLLQSPGFATRSPTPLTIRLDIASLNLSAAENTFNVKGRIHLEWIDQRLAWSSNELPPDIFLHYFKSEIWTPIIAVKNEAGKEKNPLFGSATLLVSKHGKVTYDLPMSILTECYINMFLWPRDFHTCSVVLRLQSLIGSGFKVMLWSEIGSNMNDVLSYGHQNDSEWKLGKSKGKAIPCETCLQGEVEFYLTAERVSYIHSYYYIVPIIGIVILTIPLIMQPPTHGYKIALASVLCAGISLIQLYIIVSVPSFGSRTPLLVLYYYWNLLFIGTSLINSVLIRWKSKTTFPPPRWVRPYINDGSFLRKLGLYHISKWRPQTFPMSRWRFVPAPDDQQGKLNVLSKKSPKLENPLRRQEGSPSGDLIVQIQETDGQDANEQTADSSEQQDKSVHMPEGDDEENVFVQKQGQIEQVKVTIHTHETSDQENDSEDYQDGSDQGDHTERGTPDSSKQHHSTEERPGCSYQTTTISERFSDNISASKKVKFEPRKKFPEKMQSNSDEESLVEVVKELGSSDQETIRMVQFRSSEECLTEKSQGDNGQRALTEQGKCTPVHRQRTSSVEDTVEYVNGNNEDEYSERHPSKSRTPQRQGNIAHGKVNSKDDLLRIGSKGISDCDYYEEWIILAYVIDWIDFLIYSAGNVVAFCLWVAS